MLSPHLDLARTLAADRRRDLVADARARRLRREARDRYGHPVFGAGSRRRPEEPVRRWALPAPAPSGQPELLAPGAQ